MFVLCTLLIILPTEVEFTFQLTSGVDLFLKCDTFFILIVDKIANKTSKVNFLHLIVIADDVNVNIIH